MGAEAGHGGGGARRGRCSARPAPAARKGAARARGGPARGGRAPPNAAWDARPQELLQELRSGGGGGAAGPSSGAADGARGGAWRSAEATLGPQLFPELFEYLAYVETRGRRPWNGAFHLLGHRWATVDAAAVANRVAGGAALLEALSSDKGSPTIPVRPGGARSRAALASLNRLAGLPRPHTEWRWFALARLLAADGGAAGTRDDALVERELCELERLAASMALRGCTKYERVRRLAQALEACGEGCAPPLHWGEGVVGGCGGSGSGPLGGENRPPPAAASSPLALTALEREETLMALNRGVYDVAHGGNALCKALLLRAEDFAAAREGRLAEVAQGDGLTVEHILPKFVERGSPWEVAFSPAEREILTHRLGNLALVSPAQNREAARLGFRYKKRLFLDSGGTGAGDGAEAGAESKVWGRDRESPRPGRPVWQGPLPLTAGLGEFREWDARAVEMRQARILELLSWGWALPGGQPPG